MEIDTGAAVSIISDKTSTSLPRFDKFPLLQPTQVILQTYTGESIPGLGELSVNVTYQGTSHTSLLVVKETSLIGRNWSTKIQLDWKTLLNQARTWFLELLLSANVYMHVCVCVLVHQPPRL